MKDRFNRWYDELPEPRRFLTAMGLILVMLLLLDSYLWFPESRPFLGWRFIPSLIGCGYGGFLLWLRN